MRRKSMNPVEILRLIQFLQILARHIDKEQYKLEIVDFPVELSRMTGLFHLGSMTHRRTKSILREVAICGLCSLGKTEISVSKSNLGEWQDFSEAINDDLENENLRWTRLDRFLSRKHDLYEMFSKRINRIALDRTINVKENLTRDFPKPTVSVLIEWGCRLNRIQQSYLDTEVVYPLDKKFRFNEKSVMTFRKALQSFYFEEKKKLGLEAVSLPILAEKVCAWLRIRRGDFQAFLEDFYQEHRSDIWLGSGVIRTYAYDGFTTKELSVLDARGSGPWFSREFYYGKINLPQYVINDVPRRFIQIKAGLLEEVTDQHAYTGRT